MPTITLTKINVLDAQEGGNGDEVFFRFSSNGVNDVTNTITGLKAGDARDIFEQFSYNGQVSVSLIEDDGALGPSATDDLIATNHETVSLFEVGTFVFHAPGVTYSVDYINSLL